MRRRTFAVLWGIAAVAGGALLLHWLHASAGSYAAASASYETRATAENLPMVVLYASVAVAGVCLASIGWWRPFIALVVAAYLLPFVGGTFAPLLAAAPARMPTTGMALLEAALLTAPSWVVAEARHAPPKRLPIPSRLALARREQKALPRPKHA